nr:hypothetical protein [uncultured Mediterranean phage uvMED]
MKKTNAFLTTEQRENIIDMALDWFEDWKSDGPSVYPESVQDRKNLMISLNNSQLIKHLQKYYAKDIWDFIN